MARPAGPVAPVTTTTKRSRLRDESGIMSPSGRRSRAGREPWPPGRSRVLRGGFQDEHPVVVTRVIAHGRNELVGAGVGKRIIGSRSILAAGGVVPPGRGG